MADNQEKSLSHPPTALGSGGASGEKEEKQLFKLKVEGTDLGRHGTLRYKILTWVLNESYDEAITELKDFTNRPSEYPEFNKRVTRYCLHSVDLVFAIKAKRNFPGINSLTRAKQQELREKFKEHFKELQYVLMKVEQVERDLRINDVRSTIYVIQALWMASFAIVFLAFTLEIVRGLAATGWAVMDQAITEATGWLFQLLGL